MLKLLEHLRQVSAGMPVGVGEPWTVPGLERGPFRTDDWTLAMNRVAVVSVAELQEELLLPVLPDGADARRGFALVQERPAQNAALYCRLTELLSWASYAESFVGGSLRVRGVLVHAGQLRRLLLPFLPHHTNSALAAAEREVGCWPSVAAPGALVVEGRGWRVSFMGERAQWAKGGASPEVTLFSGGVAL
jgi:hypothetical protein